VITKLDDRGQLMLVGAIVMAASLLALVVVLNSTIYTQNTNPGNSLGEMNEVERQLEAVRTDVDRLTDRIGQRDGYVDVHELNATLTVYSERKAEQIVDRRPAYLRVTLNESASELEREALRQRNRSRAVRSRANRSDWTLVDNATFNESTPFELVIEPRSLTPTTFIARGEDGGDWRLNVSQAPSNAVSVEVTYDNGTTVSESVSGNAARVNVTGGAINGTQRFAFAPGLNAPYDLRVENGHRSDGAYHILVNEASDVDTGNFHTDPGNGQPYVSRELSTAVVDVEYVSDKLSAESQITVRIGGDSE
jgi:type II secretory pathway component PulJ